MNEDKPLPTIIEDNDDRGGLEGLLIKSGATLREKLSFSESSYRMTYPPSTSNPRSYFLYGVLNEVEKAVVSVMQAHEFVKDSLAAEQPEVKDEVGQRISDNILQARLDELAMWQRKMTEFMIELQGFSKANHQDYYRHYLILHELQSLRRGIIDLKEYYGANNANYAFQEQELVLLANNLAAKLDSNKCWYAVKNKSGNITRLIENFDTRFNSVFQTMNHQSRAVLKTHHFSFGSQSRYIHANVEPGDRKLELKRITTHAGRVEILAIHVLVMIKDLLRIRNTKGHLKAINDVVKKNDYPLELHRKQTRPNISRGDFVAVDGDLCQVIKVIISKGYRYKSFRVKYLINEPLPGVKYDEVPGDWVRLIYKREPLIHQTIDALKEVRPLINPSVRQINRFMRNSIIEGWHNGLKEYVLNRPDLGKVKLDNYEKLMKKRLDGIKQLKRRRLV